MQNIIKKSKKIVIKIGSNTISNDEGKVNLQHMANIVSQIHGLIKEGKQVIIVSSGAGISGISAINKWSRKGDINYKQALCAIGQVELMNAYKTLFAEYNIHVAQMLVTREDFEDRFRTLNIRNTLFTLVDEGVVPIVNENDTVSFEEIQIGDNDTLAASAAVLWNADLLVLLSDIDGVYDKNPKEHSDTTLIEEIYDADTIMEYIDVSGKSDFGTGGMSTKILAAKKVNEYGIPMILTNGKVEDILTEIKNGEKKATVFFSK